MAAGRGGDNVARAGVRGSSLAAPSRRFARGGPATLRGRVEPVAHGSPGAGAGLALVYRQEAPMGKTYKSENAKRMHEQKAPKPAPRDSNKFKGGSNPHNGGSRGQSGQQRRG